MTRPGPNPYLIHITANEERFSGEVPMAFNARDPALATFDDVASLTRSFPFWTSIRLLEHTGHRAEYYELARHTRDTKVTTSRRSFLPPPASG